MTEANLKAYALSQGIKTNYTEMIQAEKVQLRYNFVLNASKDAMVGMAGQHSLFSFVLSAR